MFYVTRFAASILFLYIKVHLFNHQCHPKPTYFQNHMQYHSNTKFLRSFEMLSQFHYYQTFQKYHIVILNTRRLCSVVIWHKNEIQKIGIIISLQNCQFILCQFGNLALSKSPKYFQEYFTVFWRNPRLLASPLLNRVILL